MLLVLQFGLQNAVKRSSRPLLVSVLRCHNRFICTLCMDMGDISRTLMQNYVLFKSDFWSGDDMLPHLSTFCCQPNNSIIHSLGALPGDLYWSCYLRIIPSLCARVRTHTTMHTLTLYANTDAPHVYIPYDKIIGLLFPKSAALSDCVPVCIAV